MERKGFVRFVGIVFLIGAVYIGVSGVIIYTEQQAQTDWSVSKATVTDVSRRAESSGRTNSRYVYDISYEYHVNSGAYSGKIIGYVFSKAVGDTFDIKYDPESPEQSTHILEPQPDAFVSNFLGAFCFAAIGLWASGLFPFLARRRHRADPGVTE